MDQVDCVIPNFSISMAWKQDKGDVSDPFTNSGIGTFESEGWVFTEKHLGGGGGGPATLFELLKEDFAKNDVVVVLEDGGEDHGDAVRLGFDEHGLVVPVVDDGLKN